MITKRKSVRLEPGEVTQIKKFIKECGTQEIAADQLGITRQTLVRIVAIKSGKPESIEAIRKAISTEA